MNVTYDVTVPDKKRNADHKWVNMLLDFISSDHTSMCVSFDSKSEANCASAALHSAAMRHNANIFVARRNNSVYLVKGGDK
jgi:hypothetical protein